MKIRGQKSEVRSLPTPPAVPRTFKIKSQGFSHYVMFSNGKEIGKAVWSGGQWHAALDVTPYYQSSFSTRVGAIRWLLFVAPDSAVVQEICKLHHADKGGVK
jgi:hypothetical protein